MSTKKHPTISVSTLAYQALDNAELECLRYAAARGDEVVRERYAELQAAREVLYRYIEELETRLGIARPMKMRF